MAIEIVVTQSGKLPIYSELPIYDEGRSVYFNTLNVQYYYLFPLLFKLAKQLGHFIKLYDDTEFSGEQLPHLKRIVEEAYVIVQNQPAQWQVYTGRQVMPIEKDIWVEVSRSDLIATLQKLLLMIEYAEQNNESILILGDLEE